MSHVNVRDITSIISIIETFKLPEEKKGKKQLTIKLTFSRDAWPLKDEDWDLLNEGLLRPKGIGKLVLTYYIPVEHTAVHDRTRVEMVRCIRRNMPHLAVAFGENLVIRLHLVSMNFNVKFSVIERDLASCGDENIAWFSHIRFSILLLSLYLIMSPHHPHTSPLSFHAISTNNLTIFLLYVYSRES